MVWINAPVPQLRVDEGRFRHGPGIVVEANVGIGPQRAALTRIIGVTGGTVR